MFRRTVGDAARRFRRGGDAARRADHHQAGHQAPVNSSFHKALRHGRRVGSHDAGPGEAHRLRGRDARQRGRHAAHDAPGVDQLQGNLLTLPGSSIDDAFNVFGVPFFFESDAEGQYVLEKLTPVLEKRLEAKGFKLLAWGTAGWVRLFSKHPFGPSLT